MTTVKSAVAWGPGSSDLVPISCSHATYLGLQGQAPACSVRTSCLTALQVTQEMNQTRWKSGITTQIIPAGKWWDAEDYHQKYLVKNPGMCAFAQGCARLQRKLHLMFDAPVFVRLVCSLRADEVVVLCRWVLQPWHEVVKYLLRSVWNTVLNTAELNLLAEPNQR